MKENPEKNMQSMLKKVVAKMGNATPEGINLYFASRLELLTKVIIVLTFVLAVLAVIQIYLIVRQ